MILGMLSDGSPNKALYSTILFSVHSKPNLCVVSSIVIGSSLNDGSQSTSEDKYLHQSKSLVTSKDLPETRPRVGFTKSSASNP